MIQKPIEQIDKATINTLVRDKVSEHRSLDYKVIFPGNSDDEKREFLSDVSSFANSSGGDLVYGVADERDDNNKATGVPSVAEGIALTNIGDQIARLEASSRDGIAPRIQGIRFQSIEGFSKGPVIVMRVPKSWAGPHMVTFKQHSRFYSRNSTGKYPLDVAEIRTAFVESTSVGERLRSFRVERLGRAIEGDTAVPLGEGVKLLFHMVPISSVSPYVVRDVTANAAKIGPAFAPIEATSYGGRFNLDGFYVAGEPSAYVQVFRSGAIEAGKGRVANTDQIAHQSLPSWKIERNIIDAAGRFLSAIKDLNLPLPAFAMLTLIGVKGYQMASGNAPFYEYGTIHRDVLSLPEIMIEDFGIDLSWLLRPMFDAMWQAAGFPRSPNYDENGTRIR
jgi:Putative DNA-binding domain